MKINLQEPYKSIWSNGYLVVNRESRETLILYNNSKDRTSTQYARYLLSVKLNRFLNEDEHVDHIDGDKTNNNLENLQILSVRDNNMKAHCKPLVELICPCCKISFTKTMTQLRGRKDRIKTNQICCSRICGGKMSHNR